MSDRTFEDKPAVRTATPLLVGLIGPSGSGKTFSALRMATGIQRVSGGEVFVVDTESRRSLHYADKFKFRHVEFHAPFGPLDTAKLPSANLISNLLVSFRVTTHSRSSEKFSNSVVIV